MTLKTHQNWVKEIQWFIDENHVHQKTITSHSSLHKNPGKPSLFLTIRWLDLFLDTDNKEIECTLEVLVIRFKVSKL